MNRTGDEDNQYHAYGVDKGEYDEQVQGRQRTMARKVAMVHERIVDLLPASSASIVEVGCGTGLFTEGLARSLPWTTLLATDRFPAMLRQARVRLAGLPNVTLEAYDAEAEPAFPARFDVVCGCDVIHHLERPVDAMKHWLQMIKPGGALVFFETNAWNPIFRLLTMNKSEEARFKYSTLPRLRVFLAAAGWRDPDVHFVPLYLPNFPPKLWRAAELVEDALHALVLPRSISAGLLVTARAPH